MPGSPDISKGEDFIRTYDLLDHLIADVNRAFEILESDKSSQYLRRCVARTVFAFVEGLIQIVKFEINTDIRMEGYSIDLSHNEKEVLSEQKIVNGKSIFIQIPVDKNFKKTFQLAAKLWNLNDYILHTDGDDYQNFLQAKKARNRLTHPRNYYDLQVTDYDMHCYAATFFWSKRAFETLFKKKIESIAADLPKEIRDKFLSRKSDNSSER
ncbi:MAG: hypothetical protein HZB23_01285 [Deltaproteobacteria bacterium]|nr:hypothetical protein [Deltaproteobacteria bacterium]